MLKHLEAGQLHTQNAIDLYREKKKNKVIIIKELDFKTFTNLCFTIESDLVCPIEPSEKKNCTHFSFFLSILVYVLCTDLDFFIF